MTAPRFKIFNWNEAARLLARYPEVESASVGVFSKHADIWGTTSVYSGRVVVLSSDFNYAVSKSSGYSIGIQIWLKDRKFNRLYNGEFHPCWIWQDDAPEWGPTTQWPDSALEILRSAQRGAPQEEGKRYRLVTYD